MADQVLQSCSSLFWKQWTLVTVRNCVVSASWIQRIAACCMCPHYFLLDTLSVQNSILLSSMITATISGWLLIQSFCSCSHTRCYHRRSHSLISQMVAQYGLKMHRLVETAAFLSAGICQFVYNINCWVNMLYEYRLSWFNI